MSADELTSATEIAERFLDNIETVVHGKREQIKLVVAALMCGGHALLEDVPGTAKTVLARAIAGSIHGSRSSRIQCTPDLQPTDVTGLSIFNQKERDFEFRPGPVFANIVLVDEINRAMPKTQSALLEAMAEQQVTVDGETRPLDEPFLVMATQNPIEYEGTFPLPEAQLDRFFVKTTLGYPDARGRGADRRRAAGRPPARPPAAGHRPRRHREPSPRGRRRVRARGRRSAGSSISCAPRASSTLVAIGSSVRGTLALNRARASWAVLHSRRYVTPEDVEQLFIPVLAPPHPLPSELPRRDPRSRLGGRAAGGARSRCLEVAPKPGFDIDLDVPAAATA